MSHTTKEYATKADVKEIVNEAVEGLASLISTTCAMKEDVEAIRKTMATKEEVADIRATMTTKEDLAEIRATMATKEDVAELRHEMHEEIADIRSTMATKKDVHRLETKFDFLIEDHDITKARVTHLEKGLAIVHKKR